MTDILRIDAHVHSSPFDDIKYRGSGAAYVRRMRKAGIHAVALLAPGEACRKAVGKFGDFVIPVPMYYLNRLPREDLRGDIERQLDWGCRAIKFTAPLHPYSHEIYWPLYQLLVDRGALAVFHTGYLWFGGTEPQIPPIEITHMRGAHVDAVARRFPTLRILMSHFSNPWWEEAWKVMWNRPNVYADMSGHTAIFRSMTMWAETFAPDGRLMEDALSKLVFASDESYLHTGEHKFGEWVDFYQRLLDRINAPERIRKLVWAGNAKKLYGIR
ncbi:MAG: amidohydrolase family protein [Phycisphaerae bacterium]|nr:amidohydrolase family protein [Phycisphaerae bacterium]